MGLIGHEIIQSRIWVDPNNPPPPNLNYKFTFPITVFDAVRRDMANDQSETLTQVLDRINLAIQSKQTLIPAKPANYLVTYGGVAGAVGSIQISNEIPWEEADQSHTRIPSEKAVGDLIRLLGVNPSDPSSGYNIRWSDIIGRPNIYSSFGSNEFGLLSQKFLSEELNKLSSRITENNDVFLSTIDSLKLKVDTHTNSQNNPHNVTLAQIGAASEDVLNQHLNADNPHGITREYLGIENVDNTSDLDKPMSNETRQAIDRLNELFDNMTDGVGDLTFITKIEYNAPNSTLDLVYRDGSIISVDLPIGRAVDNIYYDPTTKELVVVDNIGNEDRVNIQELYIRYNGSNGEQITVSIDDKNNINAIINSKSITNSHIQDGTINNRLLENESITAAKIRDETITSAKLADKSITSKKIDDKAVTIEKLDNRAVTGAKLFTTTDDNRILAVLKGNSNPVWTQITAGMIGSNAIQSTNIQKDAVTYDKVAPESIGSIHIQNTSITTDKLDNASVTTTKLADGSVTSSKLANSLMLEGNPTIRNTPEADANNNQIVDTRWVRAFAKYQLLITSSNIEKRSITADKLFSSQEKNKVLAVLKSNQDPEWTTINNDMMEDNSVDTRNIIDLSITKDKLSDKSIEIRHLNKSIINDFHIIESAITSEKIYPSHEANRVLAALTEEGHPTYSQVTQEMLAPNSVGTKQLIDGTITLSKLVSSNEGQQVLTVGLSGAIPQWSKIMNKMIADRAVDGSKLFSSDHDNMILTVTNAGQNPTWTKVTGQMIGYHEIEARNIKEDAIGTEHIQDGSIIAAHIQDNSLEGKNFAYGSIDPDKIKPSDTPERVLATTELPYSNPKWVQISTGMIEDGAVTGDKIFKSEYPYHVLGVTQAGKPPEYTMISHQFIVDNTITPQKLNKNFALIGTPSLTIPPSVDADDYTLANTSWVRSTIKEMVKGIDIPGGYIDIPDHSIDGTKLFTHPYGPRVLGITEANGDVEFLLIEENLIANGAITTDKIERSIHLLGTPTIEVRPSAYACDDNGDGHQIPDCQWVLDRIKEYIELNAKNLTYNDKLWVINQIDSAFAAVGIDLSGSTAGFENIPDVDMDQLETLITLTAADRKWVLDTINAEFTKAGYYLENEEFSTDIDVSTSEVTLSEAAKMWVIETIDSAFTAVAIKITDPTATNPNEPSLPDESETGGALASVQPGSIATIYLQDRAVTGQKLFTSAFDNRILAVTDANSDPQYMQAINEMISDRAIDGRTLFTSSESNRVLAVYSSDTDPVWSQVTSSMIGDSEVQTNNISNEAITEDKIKLRSISNKHLVDEPIINENQLMSESVTTPKIKDGSITNAKLADDSITGDKIAEKSINGNKLSDDLVLHENTSVQSSSVNYEQRVVRNIIISPNSPTGGKNGDIWFRFS